MAAPHFGPVHVMGNVVIFILHYGVYVCTIWKTTWVYAQSSPLNRKEKDIFCIRKYLKPCSHKQLYNISALIILKESDNSLISFICIDETKGILPEFL